MGKFKYIKIEKDGIMSFEKTLIKDKSDYEKDLLELADLDNRIDIAIQRIEDDKQLFLSDITEDSEEKATYLLSFDTEIDRLTTMKSDNSNKKVIIAGKKSKLKG